MTTIYFAGGEDIDFNLSGGAGSSNTSGSYRTPNARCSIYIPGFSSVANIKNATSFNTSTFWFTGRSYQTSVVSVSQAPINFTDINGKVRLRILYTTNTTASFQKLTAAGVATTLFTFNLTLSLSTIDKWDISVNYSTTGYVYVYLNGALLGSFTGDTTSDDGITSLTGFQLYSFTAGAGSSGFWSEVIVSDSDTRPMFLQTLAPVANGNTHNFDTGSPSASNVNEIFLNDGTLDGSSVAGQIDEYTIPSLVGGTYSILAVGVSARMIKGATGPTKAQLVLRSGSTDYTSPNQSLMTGWSTYSNWWSNDPNTSSPWAALPVNIGIESVA